VPPPERLVESAVRLRERGVVRRIVVSCHERAAFAAHFANRAFDGVMARYNAAHVGAERDVFPLALACGMPLVAYTATRWGSLVGPSAAPQGERAPSGADCYRFALAHPAVTACLAGPKDARELDGVLEALASPPMSDEELAWMRRAGALVRQRLRMRAPGRRADVLRAAWDHVKGIAREIRSRGLTEDLLSRFSR
jgi:aryl-alcohol dehydrogenase-like predicted oxidoreductase